ncbi:sce7726 family protein [Tolumonas lignilytica]|uniref:sce7726 family protein n=1 Tax=Tolumonas lignilytica TaxID=1283284 RepID=UPI000463F6AD|nr:sce7726 family protein [Tolumonas lignilytica]
MRISDKYLISNLFSKATLELLTENDGHIQVANNILKHLDVNYRALFDAYNSIYKMMMTGYRNEYVFKNAIAEKIIKGRHKMANVSYFTEFRVRKVIADCVVVNGSTSAYEIKTEFDTYNRLQNQLSFYKNAFEKVYVVVPENDVKKLLIEISDDIGVLSLTKKYTLNVVREPTSNIDNLEHEIVFDCLNKNEIYNLTLKHFGFLPNVQPAFVRGECRKLFSQLPKSTINDEFRLALKSRHEILKHKESAYKIPSSLLSLLFTSNFSEKKYEKLIYNLNEVIA